MRWDCPLPEIKAGERVRVTFTSGVINDAVFIGYRASKGGVPVMSAAEVTDSTGDVAIPGRLSEPLGVFAKLKLPIFVRSPAPKVGVC